ncbi:MAG: toast rack family protein [Bacteroidota bacterium]
MKTYILLLSIVFFSFHCVPPSNDNEDFDEKDIEEIEEEEEEDKDDFFDLEEKMEEIMDDEEPSELIKDVVKQNAEGAKFVQVDINIAACKLKLSSGSKQLFTGGFAYSKKKWKPEINYEVVKEKGFLTIEQPETHNINIDNTDQYAWNLKFGKNIPLDINLELGAGVSEIKLGALPINNFNMVMGVGKTELDLRGKWKQNAEIHLDGGIGLLKVYLPENVGVQVNTIKGLGNVEVLNMIRKDKNTYVNEWYNKTKITINIYLKTGIGKIEIE